jgi:hypothetical protein
VGDILRLPATNRKSSNRQSGQTKVFISISGLLRGVETAMAEPVSSSSNCRLNVRPHLGVGAVGCAQKRARISNSNPDFASIPEGVSVEFKGEEL